MNEYTQKLQELIQEASAEVRSLVESHEKGVSRGVAVARKRARASTLNVEKLLKEYRRVSLELEKALKASRTEG